MTDTINNQIPFVPENTIDPAAGLNLSLNTIDALLQVLVQTVGANTPPAGVEGQRFIVGTAPTGAWAGQANKLARFLDGAWQFFDARYALNAADGLWYVRSATTWAVSAGGALADGSVTNAKLANVPTQTFKGRTTAANGVPEDITAAQARAILNVADGATANATDAQLRDRATHTGEQAISTVTGLVTELAGKQASNANLNALAGLAGAADRLPYFTGAGALSLTTLTGLARGLLDDTTQSEMQSTLGLGTASTRTALGTTGALYSRDSILGTVSQSGGVPTGAIIERGSNANGQFVRYADGTQICSTSVVVSAATEQRTNRFGSTSGTMYFAQTQATLPASFNGLSYMSFPDFVDSGGGFASTIASGKTASSQGVRVWSYENTNTHTLNLLSIGRWF